MELYQTMCEAKPPSAYEHGIPTIRAELLIRTIVSCQIWHCGPLAGQVNYDIAVG